MPAQRCSWASSGPPVTSSTNPLAALIANAYRDLAIGDASDDYLAELAATLLATANVHPTEAPALRILANAIDGLIDTDRPVAPVLRALRVLAELAS